VMDLMSRHELVLSDARYVVLDEADEMLDLGFLEDVETILSRCPSGRQTALFSATIPRAIAELAEKRMFDPVTIRVRAATLTIDTVEQFHVEVPDRGKADSLARVLKAERPEQAIIFVRTKIGADRLTRALDDRGLRVKALHGDMTQGSRDGVMIAFKEGRQPLLVATDIAARGLDISGVTHVVNYDVPTSPDVYVHRIGRTGRVGRSGRAITLISQRQRRELGAIERHAGTDIPPWSAHAAKSTSPNGGSPPRRDRRDPPEAVGSADRGAAVAAEREGEDAVPEPAALTSAAPTTEPRRQPRRPRHTKPRQRRQGGRARLLIGAGRAHGLEPADVVGALVERSGLEGEDVEHVRVLERFSLAEVPADRAAEAVERVGGTHVKGTKLRLDVIGGGSAS
jgi:ATP-dependent RNA helicase DeaD